MQISDSGSKLSLRLINISLGVIVVFIATWVLVIGETIILPFLIALFLSFIMEPVVSFLNHRLRIPHGLAVFLTIILAFTIMYLLGMLVYANVQSFVKQFPVYEIRIKESVGNVGDYFEQLFGRPLDMRIWESIDLFDTTQSYSIARSVLSSVGTFVTFFAKMLIVIILLAYLLTGRRNINTKINVAFPDDQAAYIINIIESITTSVQRYLGAKTIVSFITGLLSIGVFYAFGLDFAIFWGFIIFLFNYIPNIGSILASILPVLFSLLQFGSFSVAIWMLLSLTLIQITMGNFVEPRIMGYSLNLSPMIVILSLVFWGYIWGIAGMFLAVPILATLTIVCEKIEPLRFISVFLRGKVG